MNIFELYEMIDSLAGDIEFDYEGIHGAVCPFNRTNIAISYGDEAQSHNCIEDVLNDRMFNGKCLKEIAEKLDIY